jgi:hypothetical protein
VPSEGCSIEEQLIEYCGWALCLVTWCLRTTSVDTTPGTLPHDGNVVPKHVGATIHY